ncbi:UDP-glucuronosyl/UDP-glucosyltransferase family-containing protein [Strongyloides ratti]|uniref:glucuronosyltransferase n=1 Tax=Strongyloides ratti TaxID=34506 RepID=A0A090L548_STRRB|nr:UDP-glucuronosyl/UDP-glucosyltransferase family-containing protein [Strongyloides ratti]CEF64931.1 UDP-glucuronosyl/UDP-glucosyltransferase family-containing protein [Strongyloides ratti]
MFLNLLLVFFLLFNSCNAYKILIFNPKYGHSHVNFVGQIADTLVEAGHNVTVIVVDMDQSIKHPGTRKANIYHIPSDPVVVNLFTNKTKLKAMWETSDSIWAQLDMFNDFMEGQRLLGRQIFYNKELAKFVKEQKFDIGFTELINIYMLGLFKAWNIPATVTGSAIGFMDNYYEMFGLHFPASHIPTIMQPSHDIMTYRERFQNLFSYYFSKIMNKHMLRKYYLLDEFEEKYGKGFYDPFELIGDRPKTPKMIEISGIGIPDPKQLDEYWDKILSLRKYTVLISFGSFARSVEMPIAMKKGIIETVKKLPEITFIWKYEIPEDNNIEKLENLVLSKWVPQNDLLNDSRLSLFITHGGANSIAELSFRGVPAIAIPVFGDQFRNAKLIEKHNTGLVMDKSLLKNSKKLKATLVSQQLNKRPIGSKRLLIEHIEFACEFGKLPSLDLEII